MDHVVHPPNAAASRCRSDAPVFDQHVVQDPSADRVAFFAVAVEMGSSKATLRIVPSGTTRVARDDLASCAGRSSEYPGHPARAEVVLGWLAERRRVAFLCDTTTGSAVITAVSAGAASAVIVVVVVVVVVVLVVRTRIPSAFTSLPDWKALPEATPFRPPR